MRCTLLCLILALTAPATAQTIIHAGQLLAIPGRAPAQSQSILIDAAGRIVDVRGGYVTTEEAGEEFQAAAIVDLKDKYVLPGLIDSHVHITGEQDPRRKLLAVELEDADVAFRGAHFARKTLNAGFTTVRDVGASPRVIFPLRDAIAKGYVPGPRIVAAGDSVNATGGHGDVHGYRQDVLHVFVSDGNCDGAADCRRAVRAKVKEGADFIKITATGGVLSETAAGTGQQMFDDELTAVVTTARSLGRKVAAHAHDADGINAALEAGVDSIEHGTFLDNQSIRLFRRTGAYLVPTILAGATVVEIASAPNSFMPAPIKAKALAVGPQLIDAVARAYRGGVKIAFGTDSGVSRHGENAREFELMVEAGMPPGETIKAATVNAADLLGLSSDIGTIEAGKQADIIALAGDPIENVAELRNIDFVMKGGVTFKNK